MLVDPQGQGRLWLMNREEANQLKVTQLNDKSFRFHLEECLQQGKVRMRMPSFNQLRPPRRMIVQACCLLPLGNTWLERGNLWLAVAAQHVAWNH